jgi:dTDP-4-amino-4,6-dideoxygalactose transaminase
LENIPGIIRLPESGSPDFEGVVYVYLIEVERRDELAEYLGERGIETEIYYPIPLPLQPCFAELGYTKGDFPNAEAVCAHALALPFYPDLTLSEVDRTCDVIRAFFTGSSA